MTLISDPAALGEGITLGDLLTRVKRRLGADMADEHMREVINEALQFVAAQNDWPWLDVVEEFTTTADVASYTPAARWRRTREVRVDDSGIPQVGDVVDGQTGFLAGDGRLLLSPTPSGATTVRHRYVRHENELVADDDVTLMPSRFAASVINLACAYALMRLGEDRRAERFERAALGFVGQMRRDNARAHMGGVRLTNRAGYAV